MNKLNFNIFTKENYAYLCDQRPYKSPKDLNKQERLHIPKVPKPICENMHRIIDIKPFNHFIKRKEAIFHQIMVSHRQLDGILNEIGEKETLKKPEPGAILNLSRKKICDIINIYSEVIKIKDKESLNQPTANSFINNLGEQGSTFEKSDKKDLNPSIPSNADSPTKLKQKKKEENEHLKGVREVNRRLVDMVSANQQRLYGKPKYNQDKAKFLFENSSFFTDLVTHLSSQRSKSKQTIRKGTEKHILDRSRQKSLTPLKSTVTPHELSVNTQRTSINKKRAFIGKINDSTYHNSNEKTTRTAKIDRTKKEVTFISEKKRSLSEHIPLQLQEREKIASELNNIAKVVMPPVRINERNGELEFNEIKPPENPEKTMNFFMDSHNNSALNSVRKNKEKQEPESIVSKGNIIMKKTRAFSNQELRENAGLGFSGDTKEEIKRIKDMLSREKSDCQKLKKKLRFRRRNYVKSLRSLDKAILEIA